MKRKSLFEDYIKQNNLPSISSQDELGLYLVRTKMKKVTFFGQTVFLDENLNPYKRELEVACDALEEVMKAKVQFSMMPQYIINVDGMKKFTIINFLVGIRLEEFQELRKREDYHIKMGELFGYPLESSIAFAERRAVPLNNAIMKALKENPGINIPAWLSYIFHDPEELDLISGKIPKSTEELGRMYQEYTRKTNPELAERVEYDFLKRFKEC